MLGLYKLWPVQSIVRPTCRTKRPRHGDLCTSTAIPSFPVSADFPFLFSKKKRPEIKMLLLWKKTAIAHATLFLPFGNLSCSTCFWLSCFCFVNKQLIWRDSELNMQTSYGHSISACSHNSKWVHSALYLPSTVLLLLTTSQAEV